MKKRTLRKKPQHRKPLRRVDTRAMQLGSEVEALRMLWEAARERASMKRQDRTSLAYGRYQREEQAAREVEAADNRRMMKASEKVYLMILKRYGAQLSRPPWSHTDE